MITRHQKRSEIQSRDLLNGLVNIKINKITISEREELEYELHYF